jgi:hypothetical protein
LTVGAYFPDVIRDAIKEEGRHAGELAQQSSTQINDWLWHCRSAQLPANTLQVRGGSVCASLRGLPLQPCFNLEHTSGIAFRGSISGLGFAYCEFTRHGAQTILAHSAHRSNSAQPLGLRPSLAASKN